MRRYYPVGKFMLQLHLHGLKCYKYNLESNYSWVNTVVTSYTFWKERKTILKLYNLLPTKGYYAGLQCYRIQWVELMLQ